MKKTSTTTTAAILLLTIVTLTTGCARWKDTTHASKHHQKASQAANHKQRDCTCKMPTQPTHIETPSVVVAQEIND
jgi:hypothetical protein